MAKNIQKLCELSTKIRGLSLMTGRSLSMRSYQTSSQRLAFGDNQDALQIYIAESSSPAKSNYGSPQMPFEAKKEYQSNAEIFRAIQVNSQKIDGPEAVKLLHNLFKINKSADDNSIRQTKEFSQLCNLLKKNIRELNEGQTISALKSLNFFKIPTTTVIVQMLLQMLRESINRLSLEQIMFLDFLLTKCQKTPLVEALTIALPIVFDTHFKVQLDKDNLDSLITTLEFMRKSFAFGDKVPTILKALKKHDLSEMSPHQARRLSFCLLEIPLEKSAQPLLAKTLDIMSQFADTLSRAEIRAMMHRIASKQLHKNRNYGMYYHKNLLDQCIASVVSQDMGFDTAIDVLNSISVLPHVNLSLLDYIASKCHEDDNVLKPGNFKQIETFIYALSMADYKPIFWDDIKEKMLPPDFLMCQTSRLLKFAISLAILDYHWPELLTKIFSQTYIPSLKGKRRMLLLDTIVRKNFPEYPGPFLPDDIRDSIRKSMSGRELETPLKKALEIATGGEQYVATNIVTDIGHYINHAVIMRKGGFPVAINTNESSPATIADLVSVPDGQTILFTLIPQFGYVKNTENLIGFWSFVMRILQDQYKCTVIPINSQTWSELSNDEQVRYMSKVLRLEADELSANINT